MNNSFKENFENFIASLNNGKIQVLYSDMKYGSHRVNENSVLQKDIKSFYSEIEYANCKWKLAEAVEGVNFLDKEMDIIEGEINIPSIERISAMMSENNFLKVMDPFLVFNESTRVSLRNFVPFDIIKNEFIICYKRDEPDDHLYLVDYSDKGEIISLSTGINNYLQHGFKYSFFFGWQKAIFLGDKNRLHKINFYLAQLF